MRLKLILITGLCAISFTIQAQDYNARIKALNAAINSKLKDTRNGLYFETTDTVKKDRQNLHSWLWPLCALVQAANEMEVLQPDSAYLKPVSLAIDQYYNNSPPTPAYQDYVTAERKSSRFYDDNEWVAIAYLDAYQRKPQKKYLDDSKMIYSFILSGIDTVSGGGVYWKEGDLSSKNTCSNGPAILVALQLYKITKNKAYLNKAVELYQWTNRFLQSPEGTYYDNVKLPSLKLSKALYTYNTGTMLQSNVLLYQISHNKKYLTEAQRIASAGKKQFFKDGRLPNEYWFNAVLLRGYIALYQVDHNRNWIDFFETDANNIWQTERDSNNLLGKKTEKRLIDQAAMIEIYARLQQLKGK
ncbi:MAG: glycoside hydrolase [Sphingobacteriaceae bacterium]|nr:MAG: glycoside hydrolase [Sphingobacteriaceae bacterium]